jgi:hypothetical protein
MFGYVKGCMTGLLFEGAEQLLEVVQAVLGAPEKATLPAVFFEWMDQLPKCMPANRAVLTKLSAR